MDMDKEKCSINVYDSAKEWALQSAHTIARIIEQSINQQGSCTIAFSGGRTPQSVYQHLALPPLADSIEWQKLFVFWGDERSVSPDDPDSNYWMVKEALLDKVPIPPANIFRVKGELSHHDAVTDYENTLKHFFKARSRELPEFDLILLGMGVDGHIASLFPKSDILAEENQNWVAPTYAPRLNSMRITLTPYTINLAHKVVFLISGDKKAEILNQVLQGSSDPVRYPAQMVQPVQGEVVWLLDHAAAKYLSI